MHLARNGVELDAGLHSANLAQVDREERCQALLAAMGRLRNERERAAIAYKYLGGQSDAEIGASLGITAGHVRVLRHRGLPNFEKIDDITERKEAEETLRKSEEKYRDIFENVSDFLYFHDLEGHLIECNQSFRNVSGYSDDELSRKPLKELIPERYRDEFDIYLETIKRMDQAEGSMRLIKKDGSEFMIEYKNSMVYDQEQPIGIRGSARDVTERWQAKQEKRGLEKKLEHAQKMEAIGTLAGGVAHDLNNILGGIVSYPDLLLMDEPFSSLDAPTREDLQRLARQDGRQREGHKACSGRVLRRHLPRLRPRLV